MRDEKFARRCGAKHISKSKCAKTRQSRSTFKKLRCRRSARGLWREAHLQVKKLKTPHVRNTFKSYNDAKVHAVVARSTCPSQNVQKHNMLGALLEAEMSKKCTPLWREAHVPGQNVQSTPMLGPLLEVEMSKSARRFWHEAHFQVKMYKNTSASERF